MIQFQGIDDAMAPAFDASIIGTAGDDRLDGSDLNELIQGLGGDDLLQGLGGNDLLLGGGGDDTLLGGSGRDTLDGGGGHNVLNGGSGADLFYVRDLTTTHVDGGSGRDTASFAGAKAAVTWSLVDTVDYSSLQSVENLVGSHFDDHFTGDLGHNFLSGGGGDDWLEAYDRNYGLHAGEVGDKLNGGAGDDVLTGYSGNDTLKGGSGADYLNGEGYYYSSGYVFTQSADLLIGGTGDDTIIASSGDEVMAGDDNDVVYVLNGDNTLSGGDGTDMFSFGGTGVYGAATYTIGADLITDLSDADTIDLNVIDADTTISGDQHFTLVAALDGHAGQAALVYDSGTDETALELDTNGDGSADITIRMTGDHHDFTNFVL